MNRSIGAFVVFFLFVVLCFRQVLIGRVPIPLDALVGLYHPYRDSLAQEYPRGVPFRNPIITDSVIQQIPWRALAVDVMKRGEIPTWNPYAFAGYPLLANIQSAPFYPLNIIFFLAPFLVGWTILVILQPLLGGFFMYNYLRGKKLLEAPSIFGGVVFAFSGFFLAWNEWGTIAHTALWLPLILLSIDTLKNKLSPLWVGIFLFSITSSFLAGHLQTFVYVFLVSSCYILFHFQKNSVKKVLLLLGLLMLFIIFSSPIWYSQVQFILSSGREIDLSWEVVGWFIPLQHLVQFVAPDFFGNPATGNYYGIWNYGEFLGYIGIFSLLFAIIGIIKGRRRILFFSLVLGISLLFSTENVIAKIPYIFSFPFLSSTQPTRLMFLIDFSLAILAAFGMDYFIRSVKKNEKIFFIIPLFILLLFIFIFLFHSQLGIQADQWLVSKRNLILPVFLTLFSLGFFISNFLFKNELYRKYSIVVVLVVTVVDVLFIANKYNSFSKVNYFYPSTNAISYLQKNSERYRVMSVDRRLFPANISVMYKIQSVSGYDPLYLQRYAELISAVERGKPDISPPFGFQRIITPGKYESPIMSMMGVKYVLSLDEIHSPQLEKVFEEGQTKIYQNKDVLDRAFFVKNIITVVTKERAIRAMFDQDLDFKTTAIVEGGNENLKKEFLKGKVQFLKYSENEVILKTTTDSEGFLVFTDTYYPTWRLLLDGKPWEIMRTNYNFRGVIVPKGTHTLQFNDYLF